MRTAADLAAAADRAGLRLDWVEPVPVAGGGTELAAGMSFDDPWAAARLLSDLAEQDASDPFVQAWAYEMLASTAQDLGESVGPTVSPELRDAVARTVHGNVQHWVKFVPEPLEKFQSARTTMRTRQGDCDCHARLVYALLRTLGVPVQLIYFEGTEPGTGKVVPVHAVCIAEDSDGAWQWVETTIPASYGEDPHDALSRLRAEGVLPSSADPLAHVEGLGAPFGVVTASDVQHRKDQVNASVEATDVDVVNCAHLDAGTLSAWNLFLVSWRTFYADEPGFFSAGAQGRQVADYVDELAQWQAKLKAAGCSLTGAPLPAQSQDDVAGTIKLVAIAAVAVAGAFAVYEVARTVRR
jgi:Transglutaminase-like superfamily